MTEDEDTFRYYDGEKYVVHVGAEQVESDAGYVYGPEYRVLMRLKNGMYLGGTCHQDRGDLMTDVRYSRAKSEASPWR